MKRFQIGHFNFNPVKKLLGIIAIAGFLYACKKNMGMPVVFDCSGPQKSFSADVSPIIQSSCATNGSCHGAGSANGPGSLLNYSSIFNARSDIRSVVASGHMPPDGSLTIAGRAAIVCWIDSGAANN